MAHSRDRILCAASSTRSAQRGRARPHRMVPSFLRPTLSSALRTRSWLWFCSRRLVHLACCRCRYRRCFSNDGGLWRHAAARDPPRTPVSDRALGAARSRPARIDERKNVGGWTWCAAKGPARLADPSASAARQEHQLHSHQRVRDAPIPLAALLSFNCAVRAHGGRSRAALAWSPAARRSSGAFVGPGEYEALTDGRRVLNAMDPDARAGYDRSALASSSSSALCRSRIMKKTERTHVCTDV